MRKSVVGKYNLMYRNKKRRVSFLPSVRGVQSYYFLFVIHLSRISDVVITRISHVYHKQITRSPALLEYLHEALEHRYKKYSVWRVTFPHHSHPTALSVRVVLSSNLVRSHSLKQHRYEYGDFSTIRGRIHTGDKNTGTGGKINR